MNLCPDVLQNLKTCLLSIRNCRYFSVHLQTITEMNEDLDCITFDSFKISCTHFFSFFNIKVYKMRKHALLDHCLWVRFLILEVFGDCPMCVFWEPSLQFKWSTHLSSLQRKEKLIWASFYFFHPPLSISWLSFALFLSLSLFFSGVDWWVEFTLKTLKNVVVQPNLSSNFFWAQQHLSFFHHPSFALPLSIFLSVCSPFSLVFTSVC